MPNEERTFVVVVVKDIVTNDVIVKNFNDYIPKVVEIKL